MTADRCNVCMSKFRFSEINCTISKMYHVTTVHEGVRCCIVLIQSMNVAKI